MHDTSFFIKEDDCEEFYIFASYGNDNASKKFCIKMTCCFIYGLGPPHS